MSQNFHHDLLASATRALLASMLLIVVVGGAQADEPPSLYERLRASIGNAIVESSGSEDQVEPGVTQSDAEITWHPTLESAVAVARKEGKPIFAVVGAPWCSFCEKLHDELQGEPEAEIAEKWVLAKINADDQVNDARELRANALPSLRLLSSDGIVTVAQDGYAPVPQLMRWLEASYDRTKAQMPALLTKEIAELDADEIDTLLGLMSIRDVTARRVVLNRLSEMPEHAASPAIELLATGKLGEQLAALQLLRDWDAPVEGIDPWEPDSISDDRAAKLRAWGDQAYPQPAAIKPDDPDTTIGPFTL